MTVVTGPSEDSQPYGDGILMGCRQWLTQVDPAELTMRGLWLARARTGPGRVLERGT